MSSRFPLSRKAMKPEIGYPNIVIGSYIEDLIGDIEYNLRLTKPNDPHFNQLSVEKFALEKLLLEIREDEGNSPTAIAAKFVERMSASAKESDDANFVFSVSRDAAQSILDGLYFDM